MHRWRSRQFAGQRPVRLGADASRVHRVVRAVRIVVEDAETVARRQHVHDRRVNDLLLDETARDSSLERTEVAAAFVGQAVVQRTRRGAFALLLEVMPPANVRDRPGVGDDDALEAPALAQDVLQQKLA